MDHLDQRRGDESDKRALRALVWCHLSAEHEHSTIPPPSSDLRSPLRSVTQWFLNAAFRPLQFCLRMNHLTSAFYFWRGSHFYAAVFLSRREHWSAPRPHTRAASDLMRQSVELLFSLDKVHHLSWLSHI